MSDSKKHYKSKRWYKGLYCPCYMLHKSMSMKSLSDHGVHPITHSFTYIDIRLVTGTLIACKAFSKDINSYVTMVSSIQT